MLVSRPCVDCLPGYAAAVRAPGLCDGTSGGHEEWAG